MKLKEKLQNERNIVIHHGPVFGQDMMSRNEEHDLLDENPVVVIINNNNNNNFTSALIFLNMKSTKTCLFSCLKSIK